MTIHNDKGSLERWLRVVQDIIGKPTQDLSLLDLCCGECTATSRLNCREHWGVDLMHWENRPTAVDFWEEDVLRQLGNQQNEAFDLCICSDGVEHLTKPQGVKLLAEMARVSRLPIIFTPLGNYLVEPYANHPDTHKSGWLPEELEAMGWQTEVYPNWHSTLGVGAFFAHKGQVI